MLCHARQQVPEVPRRAPGLSFWRQLHELKHVDAPFSLARSSLLSIRHLCYDVMPLLCPTAMYPERARGTGTTLVCEWYLFPGTLDGGGLLTNPAWRDSTDLYPILINSTIPSCSPSNPHLLDYYTRLLCTAQLCSGQRRQPRKDDGLS